ncbi:MAG TPA: hypothetical protein PKJ47_13735, partial [Candidatus Limiplasma sp.]|nr:hypothetical protein [Candidatus Limiplasma sp.]
TNQKVVGSNPAGLTKRNPCKSKVCKGFLIHAFGQLSEAQQKTTRYAGERQKVIQKNHLLTTISMSTPFAVRKVIVWQTKQV